MKHLFSTVFEKLSFFENKLLIFVAIYFILGFTYPDLNIPALLGIFLLFIFTSINTFLYFSRHGLKKQWTIFDIILLLLGFTIAINTLRNPGVLNTIGYYCCIWMFFIILFWFTQKSTEKTIIIFSYILQYFALIVSTFIILYNIFPTEIKTFTYSIISQHSQDYLDHLFQNGYGIAIGSDIAYTAWILVFGFAASLKVYLSSKKTKLQFVLYVFFCLYMIYALVLLQRRGELIMFAVTILFLLILYFIFDTSSKAPPRKKKKYIIILICFSLTITVLLIIVWNILPSESSNRYIQTLIDLKNGGDLTNGRTKLYSLALQAFKEHSFFGIGWGKFSELAPLTGNTRVKDVHCIYLQLLCETGIFGFILIIGILFFSISFIIKHIFRSDKKEKKANLYFAAYIQIFFLLHGILDNSIYFPEFALFYIASLSLCTSSVPVVPSFNLSSTSPFRKKKVKNGKN